MTFERLPSFDRETNLSIDVDRGASLFHVDAIVATNQREDNYSSQMILN
jgi:hypothetical protein